MTKDQFEAIERFYYRIKTVSDRSPTDDMICKLVEEVYDLHSYIYKLEEFLTGLGYFHKFTIRISE